MANKTKELSSEKLQKIIMEKTMASISEASAATPSKKETKKTPKAAPAKEAKKETTKKEAQASKEKKASTTVTREVKYVYPADCNDSLSRKKFRQQARAYLKQFNTKLEKLDPKSKEYKQVAQELKDFQSQFLRG